MHDDIFKSDMSRVTGKAGNHRVIVVVILAASGFDIGSCALALVCLAALTVGVDPLAPRGTYVSDSQDAQAPKDAGRRRAPARNWRIGSQDLGRGNPLGEQSWPLLFWPTVPDPLADAACHLRQLGDREAALIRFPRRRRGQSLIRTLVTEP